MIYAFISIFTKLHQGAMIISGMKKFQFALNVLYREDGMPQSYLTRKPKIRLNGRDLLGTLINKQQREKERLQMLENRKREERDMAMMADEYDGIEVPKAFDDFVPKFFEAINMDYESAENFGEKVSNIREDEMTDAEKKKAAEKDAKKEKDFANKQKEVDKLKKELADNKDELVKIAKISRNERTKAQQNLLDDMAKKTKELKKLRRVEA